MIKTIVFNHKWDYEANRLIRSFFLPYKFELLYNTQPPDDCYLLSDTDKTVIKDGDVFIEENELTSDGLSDEQYERAICHMIYRALSLYTGVTLDWGLLTGVRPTRFIEQKTKLGVTDNFFLDKYLIEPSKLALARTISANQTEIREQILPDGYSLYVGIPFCPSRCKYCSFVSHSVETAAKLIPDYVDCLLKELEITRQIMGSRPLQSIYIGGGTPTSLSAEDLGRVLEIIDRFPKDNLIEYTLEAGRPETITREKLDLLKKYNVTRISINPQTLSDDVLINIGRNHTVEDFYSAYTLAVQGGFDNINVDLIAGLPGDDYRQFMQTVQGVVDLSPSSITIHSLTLKRSSEIFHDSSLVYSDEIGRMVTDGYELLSKHDYHPYYLYRQKNTLENHENIGYAKNGHKSFYNVVIMEELGSIISAGCGASTKLVDSKKGEIKRIYNHKFPYEYIERFEDILQRKQQLREQIF